MGPEVGEAVVEVIRNDDSAGRHDPVDLVQQIGLQVRLQRGNYRVVILIAQIPRASSRSTAMPQPNRTALTTVGVIPRRVGTACNLAERQ
jgi:hypothetical protein